MKPEQKLMAIFGMNVRTRREKMGLTQEELSEKVGVSKNTISDIEGGQKFAHAKTLVCLAKALETEVYELLKPANVKPDKAADIIAKYADEVRNFVGELEKTYIGNIGR
jgi:transcriptional regulator with XRE-family HTH domain